MDFNTILRILKKYLLLPQRLIVGIFAFTAIVNTFIFRHSIDLIAPPQNYLNIGTFDEKPEMLRQLKKKLKFAYQGDNNLYQRKCKWHKRKLMEEKNQKRNYKFIKDLNSRRFTIMTTFYVGYIVSHLPGGLLAERYGAKIVLAIALLISAVLLLITPAIVRRYGINGLLVLQFLMGLSQGPVFPAVSCLMCHWVPPQERGSLVTIVLSSGHIGILAINLLFGTLVTTIEWCYILYAIALGALLWFVGFVFYCFNEPQSNPYINATELQYLQQNIPSSRVVNSNQRLRYPWYEILTSPPLWALITATVQHDWQQSLILNEIHTFVHNLSNFNLRHHSWSALKILLPLLLNWLVSILAGILSDLLIQREILSITEARKIMTLIAFGPRICSDFSSCLLCNSTDHVSGVFSCAMGVMDTYYAGIGLTALDMSPNYVGIITAIANGIGSIGNIMAYYLEDSTKEWDSLQSIRSFFWLIITMFTSGDIQGFDHNVWELRNIKIN